MSEELFELLARLSGPNWPPAVRWDLVGTVATHVASFAAPATAKRFATVTAIRRRPADVLDALDREARRLYSGDRSGATAIRMLLDPIAAWAPRPFWSTPRGVERVRRAVAQIRRDPASFVQLPEDGLVDPVAMPFIAEGVDYAAGVSRARRRRFASALDLLWREAGCLDTLLRIASNSGGPSVERIDALLRAEEALIAGATGIVVQGRGRDVSDPATTIEEIVRAFVLGAGKVALDADGLSDGSSDVRVRNIASLTPNPARGGELLTIRGHGFGGERPASLDVVLDAPGSFLGGVVLDVVRWSDEAIDVCVPESAGAGCIGLRDRGGAKRALKVWRDRAEVFAVLNELRGWQGRTAVTVPLEIDAVGFLPTAIPCTGRNRFLGALADVNASDG